MDHISMHEGVPSRNETGEITVNGAIFILDHISMVLNLSFD